jgi:hypothetical protein
MTAMRWARAGILAALATGGASAQPTDLYTCTSASEPNCVEVGAGIVVDQGCIEHFDEYIGRIAWYPLRCVGPITVDIQNLAIWSVTYPVYVEVVPLLDAQVPCEINHAFVISILRGVGAHCGGWETSSSIDITNLVPLGALYALRLHFFDSELGKSPAIRCVRVTATPATSGLALGSWGNIKRLYR